jgi:cytochrome c peroxidase
VHRFVIATPVVLAGSETVAPAAARPAADRASFARTGPYMHDGSLKTLKEAVDFYDKGDKASRNLGKKIQAI